MGYNKNVPRSWFMLHNKNIMPKFQLEKHWPTVDNNIFIKMFLRLREQFIKRVHDKNANWAKKKLYLRRSKRKHGDKKATPDATHFGSAKKKLSEGRKINQRRK